MNVSGYDSQRVDDEETVKQVPCRAAVFGFFLGIALLLPAVPVLCRDGAEFRLDRIIGLVGAVMAISSMVSVRLEGLSLGKLIAVVYGVLATLASLAIDAFLHLLFPPISAP